MHLVIAEKETFYLSEKSYRGSRPLGFDATADRTHSPVSLCEQFAVAGLAGGVEESCDVSPLFSICNTGEGYEHFI